GGDLLLPLRAPDSSPAVRYPLRAGGAPPGAAPAALPRARRRPDPDRGRARPRGAGAGGAAAGDVAFGGIGEPRRGGAARELLRRVGGQRRGDPRRIGSGRTGGSPDPLEAAGNRDPRSPVPRSRAVGPGRVHLRADERGGGGPRFSRRAEAAERADGAGEEQPG